MRRIAALLTGKREKQSAPATQVEPSPLAITASLSSTSLPGSPLKKKRSGFFSRAKPSTPVEPVPTVPTPFVSVTSLPPDNSGDTVASAEQDFDRFAREAEADRARSSGTWRSILKRKSFSKKSRRHRPQTNLLDVEWRPRDQTTEQGSNDGEFDSDDDGSTAYSSSSSQIFHPPSRSPIPRSHTNLHALTLVTLTSTISPHPLIHNPSKPNFPRSANASSLLCRPAPNLQIQLHKTRVLTRLESRSLSPSEELSIRPFGNRPRPTPPKRPTIPAEEEAIAMQRIGSSAGSSRGLNRWALRPCFEERMVVWTENEEDFVWTIVMGPPNAAVAALEYSDGLTYLATLTGMPPRRLPPAQTPPKSLPATLIPTPLSIPPPLDHTSSSSSTSTTPAPSTPTSQTTAPLLMTGDDDVPLGIAISIKKEKEEERRLERLARAQLERTKREEQERKKKYAEEVVAARLRRELARVGGRPKSISHVDIFDDDHRRSTPTSSSKSTKPPMSSNPKRRSQPTIHHSHSASINIPAKSSSVSGHRSTSSRSSSRLSRISNSTSLSVSVPLPSPLSALSGYHTAPATFPVDRPPSFYQKSSSSQEHLPISSRSRRNSIKSEGKHHDQNYRPDDTRSSYSLPRSFRSQPSVPTILPPLPPMPYFISAQPPMAISPASVSNGAPNTRLSLMAMGSDMIHYPVVPAFQLVPPTPPLPRASHERRASSGSIETDDRRPQKRESYRVRSPLAAHSTSSLPRSVSADAKIGSRPPRTIIS